MNHRCLLIDLGPGRDDLDPELRRRGVCPSRVRGLAAARALLAQWRFDALVGLGECDAWPGAGARGGAPLLVLCGADDASALRALEAGATECSALASPAALVAVRLARLIECAGPRPPEPGATLRVGSLYLDGARGAAQVGHQPLALTRAEFELLFALAQRPGEIVRRAAAAVAHASARRAGRAVDSRVCRLRKCLQEAGADDLELLTVYGIGYCLSRRSIDPALPQSVQRRAERASLA